MMVVLQRPFLVGSHRVAVEDRASEGSISPVLKMIGVSEFRSPVSEDAAYVLSKHIPSQYLFLKEIKAVNHVLRCLGVMIDFQQEAKVNQLERLHEWAVRFVRVDGIHLQNGCIGIIIHVLAIVVICSAIEIGPVMSLLVCLTALLGHLPACLSPQGCAVDSCKFENALLDVVVEGLFRYPEIRVVGHDDIGRLPFPEKRRYDIGHLYCLCAGHVDSLAAVPESLKVTAVGIPGKVSVFGESAVAVAAAAVAGSGGAVPPLAYERHEIGTAFLTVAAFPAVLIGSTFHRQAEPVGYPQVALYFLADR